MAGEKVSLFIQCLVDSMFPETAEAMITVLERLNIAFDYPTEQTCCGQPAFNSGYRNAAAVAARRFVEIFEDEKIIVCPSGSCVHMVRHHYPELFKDDPEMLARATAVGKKTFEFSQYLVDELHLSNIGSEFNGSVTYHDSCHLASGLNIKSQPRTLLRHIKGLDFIEMKDSDTCCGFGGTFAMNYPEISTAMVDDKIENILASGAEVVTGCDISCLMNIQGRLSRRGEDVKVMHIAELLARPEGGQS